MTQNQPKSPPGLQEVWRQVQPIFKTQSLRAVRATIQVLEGVAENLEKMPEPAQVESPQPSQQLELEGKTAPAKPPAKPADSPIAPTVPVVPVDQTAVEPGEVAATPPAVEPGEEAKLDDDVWGADESLSVDEPDKPAGDEKPTAEAIAPPPASRKLAKRPAKRVETPLPAAGTLWAKWIALLDWVRDRLPDSLSDRLSDSVLTSIAGGILVLLVWITSSLLPNQAEVAQTPAVNPSPVRPAPTRPAPEQTAPAPSPVPTKAPEVKQPTVTRSPAPIPPLLPPHPPTPPPPLELTPEQSLIAAIQDQVTEVTNRYANGLIQAIQANFRDSRLIVKVSMGWYELSGDRQNKLADEMLQRAQELDFSKLEITNTQGTLLARSPVVGPNMIILQREMPSDKTE